MLFETKFDVLDALEASLLCITYCDNCTILMLRTTFLLKQDVISAHPAEIQHFRNPLKQFLYILWEFH